MTTTDPQRGPLSDPELRAADGGHEGVVMNVAEIDAAKVREILG